jgi:glutamate synthase domain-containing protein 2
MMKNQKNFSARGVIIFFLVLINAIIFRYAYTGHPNLYWWLLVTMPLLLVGISDVNQKKHAIIRNFPLIGHLRYFFEFIRPEIRQYFFESDLDGKPFNRRQRSIVYQRAKNETQTVAFGMQADPGAAGHEWVAHALFPTKINNRDLRVWIGNGQCLQPYHANVYNIGAMSYGSLSKTAIMALNGGAKLGRFAHNTGEGGISEYHLQGGDLIWQIGTGYFGCRDAGGKFSSMVFRKNAMRPEVKMIELKLSQGAKPGHGGILPAAKNTSEIAAIRMVTPGTTVHSPARHTEFNTPRGLIQFLQLLRELSEGKPVGFKMCIGNKQEFINICEAICTTGITPDFITIDGAEGGTGAALLEFTDHLGMPLYDALAFVKQTLDFFNLTGQIKIIAAGKIITGFDMLKAMALGASACYSSRGMMFALGCVQALVCHTDKCPTGVATQNPSLYKGLDPADKSVRVANFHLKTIEATKEIMEACNFPDIEEIPAARFFRKTSEQETKSFEEIYFPKNVVKKFDSFIN